jgi:biotin operon repressor
MLRGQDILVLLKLVASGDPEESFGRLAEALGMSPAEVHKAIKRAQKAGLIHIDESGKAHTKKVNRQALLEFLIHGAKYCFPAETGGETIGIPTSYAAPVALGIRYSGLPPVWPDPKGSVRGTEFAPIYRAAPRAALGDQALYELLALVDAIRGGRAREQRLAGEKLARKLAV